MNAPTWYADWRHEAVHLLQDEKQEKLRTEYRISDWQRWDFDLDAGTLTFSSEAVAKVVADIQVVGTTSKADWLWGWANEYLPESVSIDIRHVELYGKKHGIEELTSEYLEGENLNNLGWEMTAVAVRVLDALGAYRAPQVDRTGAVFFLIKSIRYVN